METGSKSPRILHSEGAGFPNEILPILRAAALPSDAEAKAHYRHRYVLKTAGEMNWKWAPPLKLYILLCLVGKKIKVSRVDNPTEEQIRQLHEEYTKALVELFGVCVDNVNNFSPGLALTPRII